MDTDRERPAFPSVPSVKSVVEFPHLIAALRLGFSIFCVICVVCGKRTLAIPPFCVTFHKQACSLKCCWRGPSCTGRRAWREPSRPLCAASQLSRLASRGCCFLHQIAPNCGGFCQSHEGDGKVAPPSKHPPSPQRLWRAGRSHTEKMRVDAGLCRLVHDKKRGQADFETGFTG